MTLRLIARKIGRRTIVFLFILIIAGLIAGFLYSFLKIRYIEVVGEGIGVHVDEAKLPKNLLFFPAEKIALQIQKENPLVSSVQFRKKIPHTLVVVVTIRKGIARLMTQNQTLLVTGDGFVTRETDQGGLPILRFDMGVLGVGSRANSPEVRSALLFLETTQSFLETNEITKFDGQSLIAKTTETDILFPQNEDIHHRLSTLQTLMSGFRIKGTMPTRLDLRFEKPIVTF